VHVGESRYEYTKMLCCVGWGRGVCVEGREMRRKAEDKRREGGRKRGRRRQSSPLSFACIHTECLATRVVGRKPRSSVTQARHNTACVLEKGRRLPPASKSVYCWGGVVAVLQLRVVTHVNLGRSEQKQGRWLGPPAKQRKEREWRGGRRSSVPFGAWKTPCEAVLGGGSQQPLKQPHARPALVPARHATLDDRA